MIRLLLLRALPTISAKGGQAYRGTKSEFWWT